MCLQLFFINRRKKVNKIINFRHFIEDTQEKIVVADDDKIRKLASEIDKYKYIIMQQEEYIQVGMDPFKYVFCTY